MESKEYFEKVMQDFNQNRKGRSLLKYCKDEAIDYDWVMEFKKNYPSKRSKASDAEAANGKANTGFIPLMVKEEEKTQGKWSVEKVLLKTPMGDTLEIKSNNMLAVAELLHKMF